MRILGTPGHTRERIRQGSVHNEENRSASPVVPLKAGSIVPYEDGDLITITGLKGLTVRVP